MEDFSGLIKHFYEDTQSLMYNAQCMYNYCWFTLWFLVKLYFYLLKGERVYLCPLVGSLRKPTLFGFAEYMLHIQETLEAETRVKQGEKGSFFPNC